MRTYSACESLCLHGAHGAPYGYGFTRFANKRINKDDRLVLAALLRGWLFGRRPVPVQ